MDGTAVIDKSAFASIIEAAAKPSTNKQSAYSDKLIALDSIDKIIVGPPLAGSLNLTEYVYRGIVFTKSQNRVTFLYVDKDSNIFTTAYMKHDLYNYGARSVIQLKKGLMIKYPTITTLDHSVIIKMTKEMTFPLPADSLYVTPSQRNEDFVYSELNNICVKSYSDTAWRGTSILLFDSKITFMFDLEQYIITNYRSALATYNSEFTTLREYGEMHDGSSCKSDNNIANDNTLLRSELTAIKQLNTNLVQQLEQSEIKNKRLISNLTIIRDRLQTDLIATVNMLDSVTPAS